MTLHDWCDALPGITALIGMIFMWIKIARMTPSDQKVAKSTAKKLECEAEEAKSQTAKQYSDIASQSADRETRLMKNIDKLERKVTELERQMDEWAKGINKLISQICDLGEEPVWRPRKINIDEQAEDTG
jgi:uncharacterized protein YhaN